MPGRIKRSKGVRRRRAPLRKKGAGVRRKNRKSIYKSGRASQVIIRQPSAVPDRLFVKLRYREELSWTQISGLTGVNVYRGNSLFDPDLTGTGGQPYFFDQWAALYDRYRVIGSSIKVNNMLNNANVYNGLVTVVPLNTSSVLPTSEEYEESPYARTTMLKATNAGGWGKVSHYMSTAKIRGIRKQAVMDEDSYASLTSTNPGTTWFWHVVNRVPGQSTQSNIQDITLTYYVIFEQRTSPAIS